VEVSTHFKPIFAEARCKPWRGRSRSSCAAPAMAIPGFRSDQHFSRFKACDKSCGSRYRPPRRSDQCASITRLSSGQRAIRFAAIPSSARALPHLRPRHRRTSHPVAAYRGGHQNSSYSRSSGSERAEPIFITASCSQDVMRSARRDPARISVPRGWRGSPLTLRAGIRPLSTQPPPALLPVSRSARGRLVLLCHKRNRVAGRRGVD
jgi:hypothetical protein